jgi:hypothetical protein
MAIAEGHRFFDFGSASPQGSLGAFKAQWGAEPVDEYAYRYPAGSPFVEGSRPFAGGSGFRHVLDRLAERVPLPLLELAGRVAPYA